MGHGVDSLIACRAGNVQAVRTKGKASQANLQRQHELDLVTEVHLTGSHAM